MIMKTIIDIVNEDKSGQLKKIYMLSIIIIYQMNTEFKVYEPKEKDILSTKIKDRVFQRSFVDNYFYE